MKWQAFILFALLLSAAGLVRAETIIWSDNFETGAGSRWITNSVWKIGAPTIGPGGAYSGTNCATTGLTSGAAYNVDSRFICTNYNGLTNVLIPAASQFPRLCFQQWFNFVNAEGYVEIKPSGATNWQTISVTNLSYGSAANSSGIWSRPSIDLSAFAGSSVQFAFHFTSGGNHGTDPGWYLDDVELVAGQPVFNNPESFESGLGDWSVDNGVWLAGQPVAGTNSADSGTNCAGTILNGNYPYNSNSRLISPAFVVPTNGTVTLNYAQWYKFVNAEGFVELRIGTNAWQTLSATNLSYGSTVLSSGGWVNTNIDLTAYSGDTVQVAFHFISGGTGYSTAPGWYIDDVSINNVALLVPTATSYVYVGSTLLVTNVATLMPSGPATFTSLSILPAGATLNPSSGLFTWTPTTAEADSSAIVTLSVTNANGLGATNSFAVQVLLPPSPVLMVNQASALTAAGFNFSSTGNINGVSWQIETSTNLSNWSVLTNVSVSNGLLQVADPGATNIPYRFYRAVLP